MTAAWFGLGNPRVHSIVMASPSNTRGTAGRSSMREVDVVHARHDSSFAGRYDYPGGQASPKRAAIDALRRWLHEQAEEAR